MSETKKDSWQNAKRKVSRDIQKKNDLEAIRYAINDNTSSDILDVLADYPSVVVRITVAKNKNVLSRTLDYLSKDEERDVRGAVVRNSSKCWNKTLKRLSRESFWIAAEAKMEIEFRQTLEKNNCCKK